MIIGIYIMVPVGRTIFHKVCYILTRTGIPTGFNFIEGSYGPYAKEVKQAICVLSNANYIVERQLGKMVETVVDPSFDLPRHLFKEDEVQCADRTSDLLCRIKSTYQAEMIAAVLFLYDKLKEKEAPTAQQIFNHIMKWKPRWKNL